MIKLSNSELNVLEVLWNEGETSVGNIAKVLKEKIGWNRNTTYTIIKRCIEKGVIIREDKDFICKAMISREEVQKKETSGLIERMFDGSKMKFFSAFLSKQDLSEEEIKELKEMVSRLQKGD